MNDDDQTIDAELPPALAPDAHKGDAGRVLCVAGSRRMPGAAVLVARAAQRAGAGLVTLACLDQELMTLVPVAAPEAVLREPGAALEVHDQHALLFGPGVGDDERARTLLAELLAADTDAPRVLDADALNALDGAPERLRDATGPVVLTPHPGEAARLLRRAVPRDADGRRAFAQELAEVSGTVVCLKGAGTVVSDGGRVFVNRTGNPGMATAGAGDVLAGVLVAYLARRVAAGAPDAFAAAVAAVHVHGLAGDVAEERVGARALIASDLIDALGAAQEELEVE